MKRYTLLIIIAVLSFLFSGCKKELGYCGCAAPQVSKSFSGSMKKTTTLPWTETVFNDTIKNDTLTILANKTNYNYAIKLKFGLDNGTTKLVNGMSEKKVDATFYHYGYTPGGILIYKLDNTANNTLFTVAESGTLESNKGKWVVGYFNLTFKLATPTGNMAFDTTRVYFPGRFAVKSDK
jgi:hypothetical protein